MFWGVLGVLGLIEGGFYISMFIKRQQKKRKEEAEEAEAEAQEAVISSLPTK